MQVGSGGKSDLPRKQKKQEKPVDYSLVNIDKDMALKLLFRLNKHGSFKYKFEKKKKKKPYTPEANIIQPNLKF